MNAIKPYLAAFITLLLAMVSIADVFFLDALTELGQLALWISLTVAALISMLQIIRMEKEISNISEQLTTTKERLGNEIKHRLWAEKTVSETKIKSQIIDENIPVMLA